MSIYKIKARASNSNSALNIQQKAVKKTRHELLQRIQEIRDENGLNKREAIIYLGSERVLRTNFSTDDIGQFPLKNFLTEICQKFLYISPKYLIEQFKKAKKSPELWENKKAEIVHEQPTMYELDGQKYQIFQDELEMNCIIDKAGRKHYV